ncbi:MAG: methyltransferase domain-containing protein, partial [Planctomycetes bacterium]|nr:methyltransferase domain-containing protein [Planctomycetota bacterium]
MKERFVEILACPDCAGGLSLAAQHGGGGEEVLDGELRCGTCGRSFPIVRGIPRFVPQELGGEAAHTARAFGESWTRFGGLSDRYKNQLLEWIAPVRAQDLQGKTLLDAGCGKGRHLAVAAELGVKFAAGADLSCAVEMAYRNTVRFPNVLVVQADLHRLPLRPVFDYGWSIGVIHHISGPAAVLGRVIRSLRPGGRFSAWVYGRENNGWIVHVVNPLRKRLTSRMRFGDLDALSRVLAGVLYGVCR